MPWVLGIDLGTTFSAAAVSSGQRLEVLALGAHASAIPSAIFAGDDGLVVGEVARALGDARPDRLAVEFKRRIGETAPILLGDRFVTAEELQETLATWVFERACQLEGSRPEGVVVSCPAFWGAYRRDGLLAMARKVAGDAPARLISEPEAASIYYATRDQVPMGAVVGVYDFGGGTFDASVLRKTVSGFEILGRPAGDNELGGVDLDRLVFEHVAEQIGLDWKGLDRSDPSVARAIAQLRRDLTQAKELLSSELAVDVSVSVGATVATVRLTRRELEQLAGPIVGRTMEVFDRALAFASVTAGDLYGILSVGGSSRTPLIAHTLGERYRVPVHIDVHAKFAVCLGAACSAQSDAASTVGSIAPSPPTPVTPPPSALAGAPRAEALAAPAVSPPSAPSATGPTSPATPAAVSSTPAPPVTAPPVTAPPVTAPQVTAPPVAIELDPVPAGPVGPRRGLRIAAAAMVAIALIGILVAVTRGGTGTSAKGPGTSVPSTTAATPAPASSTATTPAATAATTAVALSTAATTQPPTSVATTTVAPTTTVASGSKVGTFAVGKGPDALAFDGTSVWAVNVDGSSVTKLAASSGAVIGTYPVGAAPSAAAFDGTNLWVVSETDSSVTKLVAATGAVLGHYGVGTNPAAVLIENGNVWVANYGDDNVTKLVADTGALVASYPTGPSPGALAFDGTNIWVTNDTVGTVTKLLASSGAKVGTYKVGNHPFGLAYDKGSDTMWVPNEHDGTVTKLAVGTGATVGTYVVGARPSGIVSDGKNVWVSNFDSNSVSKLAVATGDVVGTFPVGTGPSGVVFDGAHVWVSNSGDNTVTELG